MAEIHLVRHTAVASHWAGRCYGQSDVGLSSEGRAAARALAVRIIALQPRRLIASPLRRARYLAGLVRREEDALDVVVEPRLSECHFGDWEGQSWDAIYAATGDAMIGMLAAPSTFRPGTSGETTYEVRDRAVAWLREAASAYEGPTVAICHGGPIAAILGTLQDRPVTEWPSLVPPYGTVVSLNRFLR
jgi:broad specificity phosphatase PhoE